MKVHGSSLVTSSDIKELMGDDAFDAFIKMSRAMRVFPNDIRHALTDIFMNEGFKSRDLELQTLMKIFLI